MSLFRTTSSRFLLAARLPIVRAPIVAIRHKTTSTDNTTDVAPRRTTAAPSADAEPSELTNAGASVPWAASQTPIDSATGAYSPIPSFPEDRGPDDVLAASVISGAPVELQSRTVRIYKPAKTATQSGNWKGRQWKMDWDVLTRGHRWENPLMGWQSTGDAMHATDMFFKSKEDAIHFAEKQGYDWFVQEPNVREFRSKSYAANFVHSPSKLKVIRTK
ncbi:ETC complex I subunit conserved region-domain-containing protein [Tricharina praecox]|uniref:ETC complex I subunit conserved region-domain-containing protein n=1 Tax=Tricharina praecox TaxID=43433 RepID=UPI002220986D|nr:ETC complex I subunit conserved region-domain-containing protein [Tricharina praecox]KAI5848241.1 ETC complex I subunit conserved region-domain-containing protein [Tricharina praecox]